MKHYNNPSELDRVVLEVLPEVAKKHPTAKAQFLAVLIKVMHQVNRKKQIDVENIRQAMNSVLNDFRQEYGSLPLSQRSWEGVIAYLYVRFVMASNPKVAYEAPCVASSQF